MVDGSIAFELSVATIVLSVGGALGQLLSFVEGSEIFPMLFAGVNLYKGVSHEYVLAGEAFEHWRGVLRVGLHFFALLDHFVDHEDT